MRWFRPRPRPDDGADGRTAEVGPDTAEPAASADGRTAEVGPDTAEPAASAEPPASPLEEAFARHEWFFDAGWYAAQAGKSFDTRADAVAHARRWMDDRGLSPHPLYLVTWGRVVDGKTRLSHSESYLRLLTQGWTGQDPHPAVDLGYVATQHPESLSDPDGVFGWLVKRLVDGVQVQTVPGPVAPLDWEEFRTRQLAALRAQQQAATRMPQWRAHRESATFEDADAERELLDQLSREPATVAGPDPLVSVVMPAFNRAAVLGAAVRSVQAQTLTRWELVVVDDGSADDTAAVLRELAADDPRIIVVEQPHRGVSAARNAAIARARAPWVAFLDTDNTWAPRYLEAMTAALSSGGARHGYCAMRIESEDGVVYRGRAREDLIDVGNSIDLNVWMVDRDLLTSVGGFDERLRRAVDYDLIWRVSTLMSPHYVPLLGADYRVSAPGNDRITDVESFYWKDVVRGKNVVDWDDVRRRERRAGVSAVVVWRGEPLRDLVRTLRGLGTAPVGEIVVAGTAGHRHGTAIVHAESVLDPRVREVGTPPHSHVPLIANIAFGATTHERVLFLRPGTIIPDRGVEELADAVADGAAVAQPVVLDDRGVILHAGFRFLDDDADSPAPVVPSRLLEDHLPEDLGDLPDRLRVDGASLTAMLVDATHLAAADGFDALYGNVWFDVDYALRAAADRPVVTCTAVLAEGDDRREYGTPTAMAGAALLLARHTGTPRAPSPWHSSPLAVVGLEFDDPAAPGNAFLKAPRPVLALQTSAARRRIAVKHCAPAAPVGLMWGDTYYAQDLGRAFAREGHDVRVDSRDSVGRRSVLVDEINVVVRGVRPLHPVPGAINVLWIISHPDRVKAEELVGFDLVYVASTRWAQTATRRFGREVKPLLQATEPSRFHPRPPGEKLGPDVLFVGNRRSEYRRPVGEGMALAAAGIDVGIYGGGWSDEELGAPIVRGEFLSNDDLPRYYASASVVMNDHFPTMRDHGIINNRIFDALACGTPVLTDEVSGGREVLGDRVLWYEDAADIPGVLRDYLADPWTEERRAEVAEWTRVHHSFAARAATILEDVAALER